MAVVSRVSYGQSYLLHTKFHRAINQNCSSKYQPISLLQGSLESPFTCVSYGERFISQLEVVSEI